MKPPGQPVHHAGEDYLCVEGGFNAATRTITLMAPDGSALFPHREQDQPVSFPDLGQWYAVARWSPDDLLLPDPRHHERRELASEVIEQYLASTPQPPETAWAISGQGGFSGRLMEVMPQGLAVELYDSLPEAEAAAQDQPLVAIHDVARFLTHLAREGYAGALWNGTRPVFFCLDEQDELQFLRITGGAGKVIMELLDAEDRWDEYEGAEGIEFLDNSEACDARLLETVGKLPLLDWPEDGRLWSVGPAEGQAGIVSVDEDGLEYALLFSDREQCGEWLDEEIEADWRCFEVADLAEFLTAPGRKGIGALLNPGSHRARRGVFWHDGERIVLDSFSGFWELTGEGFAALEVVPTDEDDDEQEPGA